MRAGLGSIIGILSLFFILPIHSYIHTMNTKISIECFTIPLSLYSLFSILLISNAADTMNNNQSITDGKTIVSSHANFEMGFFSPGNSVNRYVGIWYANMSPQIVVWVANREIPLNDINGVLKIIDPGILVLLNSTNNTIWSTNTSRYVHNPVVQLLDSGNLVVRDVNDDNPDNFLWQSFDYPCDTLLPGMKLGKNLLTGREWYLSSWKSSDDPARGLYTCWLDIRGYPQLFASNGSVDIFRSGPWNGLRFSGTLLLRKNPVSTFGVYFEKEEVYYKYDLLNSSFLARYLMTSNGVAQRWTLTDRTRGWVLVLNAHTTISCDTYKLCGPYGNCDADKFPMCVCLSKFVPKNAKYSTMQDWSNGCVRRTPLDCQNGDGFLKYSGIKLPDTRHSWFNKTMTLGECKETCLKNCSCMAYSNLDIRGAGSGCLLWFADLLDIRFFGEEGQDIYIRMASSVLGQHVGFSDKKREIIIVTLTSFTGILLLGLSIMLYVLKMSSQQEIEGTLVLNSKQGSTNESQNDDLLLPLFDFAMIANSTNNFSVHNKLGEGGFGPVYKGMLEDGQEIAVKRLSKYSRQGLEEFKNEVIYIAKLQHRNLVKLIGCCIEGEEKMLIYEFMPNKSLDLFIFGERKQTFLDWPKQFHIINGIARGLLYLHQDSRLRIIHRDLKASNVLLDTEMNPKIADFGLAKSFVGNETEGNTNRVVGTYGYMSPEYVVDGLFSVKSDVFSFGVIVLEIVSGKSNRRFVHPNHHLNLLGHAWRLYKEGRSMELIDVVKDSCCLDGALRSIHVGLLCVQQNPESRPTMSSVVLMLESRGSLPMPEKPGFFAARNFFKADDSSSSNQPYSANGLTNSIIKPR